MDGADASTTFTDETGKTWTGVGTAQLDTAEKKLGTASLLLDGNSDAIYAADTVDHEPAAGDFTVDYWIRFADTSGTQSHWARRTDTNGDGSGAQQDFFGVYHQSNTLEFASYASNIAKGIYRCAWTPSTNTWYHIAFVRNGTNFYIFIDGVSQALTTVTAISTNDLTFTYANQTADKLNIGRYGMYNGFYTNGWIDEFRFIKGSARWTRNFKPYLLAYTLSATHSGGDMFLNSGYYYHAFPENGTFTSSTSSNVLALVVAGGGGGGGSGGRGGGGGGGGIQYSSSYAVTAQGYSITVGNKGVGAVGSTTESSAGGNSVFGTLTATGGGRGGGEWNAANNASQVGGNGGCGGGASAYYNQVGGTGSQGYNGGNGTNLVYGAGGGGGMGAVGAAGSGNDGGVGGAGVDYSSIFGTAFGEVGWFSGGGGGGATGTIGAGGNGGGGDANGGLAIPNTGGGGGGQGGAGGSGIVIISYLTTASQNNNFFAFF